MDHKIYASILSADFSKLGEEIEAVIKAGADGIHFDIMDNHYVPNLSVGPMVLASLRDRFPDVLMDVHLMTNPVDRLLKSTLEHSPDHVSIHASTSADINGALARINHQSVESFGGNDLAAAPEQTESENVGACVAQLRNAGLALNPDEPIASIKKYLDKVDQVLVMGVMPGFGGQSFIPAALDTIGELRSIFDKAGRGQRIIVDGGVNAKTISEIACAGAHDFVVGSGIFSQSDYRGAISNLRSEIENA